MPGPATPSSAPGGVPPLASRRIWVSCRIRASLLPCSSLAACYPRTRPRIAESQLWNDGGVSEGTLRLMAVHAHPDDEASKGAATVARYAAEGVEVLIVTCTGGERGSILNPAMDRPDVLANLAGIRHAEMDKAIEILGAHHAWLGIVDSGLPEGAPLPP